MAKDLLPAASVTPEIIEKWKKQYGSVAKITVAEKGETKTAFVRSPTNKEIDYASANLTRGALTQYGITLFHTCQIGGDQITGEDALRNVGQKMNDMIEAVEVELEKAIADAGYGIRYPLTEPTPAETKRKEITYAEWYELHKKRIDGRRKMFALIRYYYAKEPYDLTPGEIARLWIDLVWIREIQEEGSRVK